MNKELKAKFKLADKLDDVAERHDKKGWCTGSLYENASAGSMKACAVGHVREAYGLPREGEIGWNETTAYSDPVMAPALVEMAKDIIYVGRSAGLPVSREYYEKEFSRRQALLSLDPNDTYKLRDVTSMAADIVVSFNDTMAYSYKDAAAQFRMSANRVRSEAFEAARVAELEEKALVSA